MRLSTAAAAFLLVCVTAGSAPARKPASAEREAGRRAVMAVVERSKRTQAVYALYGWKRSTHPGQAPHEEWSAEFHSGNLHRTENPRQRIVADCAAEMGYGVTLDTGETFEGGDVALLACGIDTTRSWTRAEHRGTVSTPFGEAEWIRLISRDFVRTYHVRADGALLHGSYAQNSRGEPLLVILDAVAVLPHLPAEDMFGKESLARSYVPEQYRRPPPPSP